MDTSNISVDSSNRSYIVSGVIGAVVLIAIIVVIVVFTTTSADDKKDQQYPKQEEIEDEVEDEIEECTIGNTTGVYEEKIDLERMETRLMQPLLNVMNPENSSKVESCYASDEDLGKCCDRCGYFRTFGTETDYYDDFKYADCFCMMQMCSAPPGTIPGVENMPEICAKYTAYAEEAEPPAEEYIPYDINLCVNSN